MTHEYIEIPDDVFVTFNGREIRLMAREAAVYEAVLGAHPQGIGMWACGAVAHEFKIRFPHSRTTRCMWCRKAGHEALDALVCMGLVARQARARGGDVYLPVFQAALSNEEAPDNLRFLRSRKS